MVLKVCKVVTVPVFPHDINSLIGAFILIKGSESTKQLRIKIKSTTKHVSLPFTEQLIVICHS